MGRKRLNENITEDNLTIVLNYVFNTDEGGDQYGDSFLYEIDIWKKDKTSGWWSTPITRPVYQTYKEMMNGDDYDIDYALRKALREAYPEYIIDYVELVGNLYDMTAIINYRDENGNHIDTQVAVLLEEVEDTVWDDETRLSFWA